VAMAFAVAGGKKKPATDTGEEVKAVGPQFNADSAYAFCAAQCDFGPRTMNSEAHEKCAEWIVAKFKSYGCTVEKQSADLKGYDGTTLKATNIIAHYRPELTTRIVIAAHWDSRPWADNDPDSANHRKPVMAANDGASGVAVMLEVARLLGTTHPQPLPKGGKTGQTSSHEGNGSEVGSPQIGIDFICFDAEDWGAPYWADVADSEDTWALGAQYWASHLPEGYEARYGVLLDMVGGQGAHFYREGFSDEYAKTIVDKLWAAARAAGYGSFFPDERGGYVTDDHLPMNKTAGIATADIIACYPECQQSSFGPTWHTINDDMAHIDKETLRAVGQTLIQVIYTEE
ncbi:MAG: M28 family peptidase, partial [Prevotella sp.]|nr:M28 family peptidase [Prevotella sp.]